MGQIIKLQDQLLFAALHVEQTSDLFPQCSFFVKDWDNMLWNTTQVPHFFRLWCCREARNHAKTMCRAYIHELSNRLWRSENSCIQETVDTPHSLTISYGARFVSYESPLFWGHRTCTAWFALSQRAMSQKSGLLYGQFVRLPYCKRASSFRKLSSSWNGDQWNVARTALLFRWPSHWQPGDHFEVASSTSNGELQSSSRPHLFDFWHALSVVSFLLRYFAFPCCYTVNVYQARDCRRRRYYLLDWMRSDNYGIWRHWITG